VRRSFPAQLALLSAAAWIAVPSRAESLDSILAGMDRASKDFKSMSARIRQTDYTAVIDETNVRSGEVRLKRAKSGLIALVNFQEPEPRFIHLSGHTAEVYYPKANTVEIYDAGKFAGTIDQLLLLGFGTSTAETRKTYTITLGGVETVGSVRTNRLDLTPTTPELKKNITAIELWIPEGKSNPLQEKILKSSRDYTLISYAELQLNPPLPDAAFALNLPAEVRKIHPQK
jgi:outer membrane lipoprotein-sorting protein